jgi:DNA gyrase subunit A
MNNGPADAVRQRLEIVDGLLRALDERREVDAEIERSSDRNDARHRLTGDGLGFSPIQAEHILDMTLGRRTQLGQEELLREQRKLREDLRRLSTG